MSEIRISVKKARVPDGAVLLEDVAALASGMRDALARVVQYRLGDRARGRLRDEVKALAPLVLIDVAVGSGVLVCQPLDTPGVHGRNPATLAAFELVDGLQAYSRERQWRRTVPWLVRSRLGAAFAPVLKQGDAIELSVEDGGVRSVCLVDRGLQEALQAPEELSPRERVHVVGRIYDINVDSRSFKLDAVTRKVSVPFEESQLPLVDELRWKDVFVSGVPADARMKAIASVDALRRAEADEVPGVTIFGEQQQAQLTEAYSESTLRLDQLRALGAAWDSYSAKAPREAAISAAHAFLEHVSAVFLDYSLELPVPFIVPTRDGNVQLEWANDGRELELEISDGERFGFLRVLRDGETLEGLASRWDAIRYAKWVAVGEEP